jgi:hypothetical protein
MAVYIVHGLAVKFCAVLRWTLAACWHWPLIAFAIVEMMIYVSIEMIRPVIPRPHSDENTACEPLGAIVAIRSAGVRGSFVISVRTNRRLSDADSNLRDRVMGGGHQKR